MKYPIGTTVAVIEGFYYDQVYVITNVFVDKEYEVPMYQLAVPNPKRATLWLPEYNLKPTEYQFPAHKIIKILKRFEKR